MVARYKTIAGPVEALFKEKASKFYAMAYPLQTEAEAKSILEQVRKKYFDSPHVCYAYVLGADKSLWRINDAGEPANTAGKPILGQITAFDLTNVIVIVVRYFGGTKLGVGGLIQAYKQSAYDCLQKAIVLEREVMLAFTFACTYENLGAVLRELKRTGGVLVQNVQAENCLITADIPLASAGAFGEAVALLVTGLTQVI